MSQAYSNWRLLMYVIFCRLHAVNTVRLSPFYCKISHLFAHKLKMVDIRNFKRMLKLC